MRRFDDEEAPLETAEVFERSDRELVPDTTRLVDSAATTVAEALQLRERKDDPLTALVPLAWRAVPRLGALAAVLLALAVTLSLTNEREAVYASEQDTGIESLLLTGETPSASGDLLLDAVVSMERADG